jgi:2-furoyl-CoA dehydrogenase FAD binding subunit
VKPAPFAYVRPAALDDVLAELAGGDGKVLAGGQSLVPVLAMRLGRPATLVDIGAVAELGGLRRDGAAVHVGATVRQRRLERSAQVHDVPLLAMALPFVGHRELRSRGTVCGSLAHADPAAELPVVLAALNGTVTLRSRNGERTVPAREFFLSFLMTVAEPNELVTAITLPDVRNGGAAFEEFARRPGDFALVSVACVVSGGQATVALGGVSGAPVIVGPTPVDPEAAAESPQAIAAQAAESISPPSDVHGSREYRQHLTRELVERAMRRATGGRS